MSPHRMQTKKNHSLQVDLVCPFVSSESDSTVVEMNLTVRSGGHVENVGRTPTGGGGVVVAGGDVESVPKHGQPGATVISCWTNVTEVSAVTQG